MSIADCNVLEYIDNYMTENDFLTDAMCKKMECMDNKIEDLSEDLNLAVAILKKQEERLDKISKKTK